MSVSIEERQVPSVSAATAASGGDGPRSVSVTRRRLSKRGLVLSVLVVLLGGLVAYMGASTLTEQHEVLVIARDVPAGSVITEEDLDTASVSKDPAVQTIAASDRDSVVGQIAQSRLVQGALLTPSMVGPGTGLTDGKVLVALPLKEGQFPARGLIEGQKVQLVATASSQPDAVGSGEAAVSGATFEATVVGVGALNAQTQVTVVDVEVDAGTASEVAQLAATGSVAVILLPED